MKKLTPREQDTLEFIRAYIQAHGYAPSWKEIGHGIFVESSTAVQRHLVALCEKGYITITPRTPRAIVLTVQI